MGFKLFFELHAFLVSFAPMQAQEHHIITQKTARYWTFGELSANTEQIWLVCHGYGQLSEFFIKKFDHLDPQKHFVIAPEAFAKFYLDGFSGRVGASWLTKEHREAEIKDYIHYLSQVYRHFEQQQPEVFEKGYVNFLGFSQSGATITRLAFGSDLRFDRLIIWAGGIAHDLDFSRTKEVLAGKSLCYVYGKQDELIKPEHFEEQKAKLKALQLEPKIIEFEGKHTLHRETISLLAEQKT